MAQVTTTSPNTTEEEGDEFDNNLIYITVGFVVLFIIVLVIIVIETFWQQKSTRPPARSRSSRKRTDPVQFVDRLHSQDNESYNAYDDERTSSPKREAWWEIPPRNLKLFHDKILGSGQYGIVLLGEVKNNSYSDRRCAVKTLKPNATEAEKVSLRKELENMSGMDSHPNVVNLIGAQSRDGNILVVVEYCKNGSLYEFLKKNRREQQLVGAGIDQYQTTIKYATRLRIAFDIANGMNYLATKGFVHRDLAARNVLLDDEFRAKVSDFGRSRDINKMFLQGFESLRKRNEPIPTRWMPVETLVHQVFTSRSDVWSYGVLLWEIESAGVRPYDNEKTYFQVYDKVVRHGYRLPRPQTCPDVMYRLMEECWATDPEKRPTFGDLSEIIGNLLKLVITTPPSSPTYNQPMIRHIV